MSSHAMSIRGSIRVKPHVTLPLLVEALQPVFDQCGLRIATDDAVDEFGDIPFADRNDEINLPDRGGILYVNLSVTGPGNGILGDGAEGVADVLSLMVDGSGVLEYIDHDVSPSYEDGIVPLFLGETEQAKQLARVNYGLGKAREWLELCVPEAALLHIEQTAREAVLASVRLATVGGERGA